MYFDDFKVEHIKSPVIQSEDFYPFGLTFNSYQRENALSNKYKFQGQERIDDLGLNWDSFKWRNHQPDIGRFFGIDKLAEKYYYNSPYAFSENKVVAHRELEGLESVNVNISHSKSESTREKFDNQPRSGGQLNLSVNLSNQNVKVEPNKYIKDLKFSSNTKDGVTTITGSYKFAASSPNGINKPTGNATFNVSINSNLEKKEVGVNTSVKTDAPVSQIQTLTKGDLGSNFMTGQAPARDCSCLFGNTTHLFSGDNSNNLNSNANFQVDLFDNGKSLFLDKASLNGGAYKSVEENNKAGAIPVLKKEE